MELIAYKNIERVFNATTQQEQVIAENSDGYRIGFNSCEKFYLKEDVDDAIAELKAKLENVQASAYADSVDAGMRERRLRRALYNACANWAKCEERINNRDAYEASEYLPSAEDKFRKKAERWSEMETKCRAKVESYL